MHANVTEYRHDLEPVAPGICTQGVGCRVPSHVILSRTLGFVCDSGHSSALQQNIATIAKQLTRPCDLDGKVAGLGHAFAF